MLPAAHGGPPLRARLRARPEDFVVDEMLGFEPSGQGEHAFLRVEKRDANTAYVAERLARHAGVAPMAVGYAGLKDRHAVARQHFTVQLGRRPEPDWSALDDPAIRVLSSTRHARKLPRGALRGNRFELRLTAVDGDRALAALRLEAVAMRGIPNYFGTQRFGRDEANLELARALFAGAHLARAQRGFALSAARSAIFNAACAARVADSSWNRALEGDVWMLEGTHSIFGPVPVDAGLEARVDALDVHPTGPLWGAGALRTEGAARALELEAAQAEAGFAEGLALAGLRQERRALRTRVQDLDYAFEGDVLHLRFALASGAYATALVAEIATVEAGG